ncbi:cytochrome c assembly protein [Nocardioides sp. PD653]|nr:cytochrome c assembly protein [Nocardioides sp. PD653-B2]GAW56482.1 cytochrome c assembly protein [Nocardioides sp. PD653]
MTLSTQAMAQLSNNLVYSAIAVYAIAMLAYAAEAAGRTATTTGPSETRGTGKWFRLGAVGTSLTVLAFALNSGGVLARGLAAQRAPWGNMYEFAIVGAVAAGGAYLALLYLRPVRDVGVWIVAIVLLALGLAVTVLYTPVDALVPVLNSYWLVIHVAAAITAGGVFSVGAVATGLFLLKSRSEKRAARSGNPPGRRYAASLPASSTWEQVAHTAHMFAFPIWTFAVIAGAIWAENSWGR